MFWVTNKMVRTSRKAFHILLILHLSVATFTVAALPDACFCGQTCPVAFCEKLETKSDGKWHKRCHGRDCKSCNVEEAVSLDTHLLNNTDHIKKRYDAQLIVVVPAEHPFEDLAREHFGPVYSTGDSTSPPSYLQNLSLRF